jgi:hypothetical protein
MESQPSHTLYWSGDAAIFAAASARFGDGFVIIYKRKAAPEVRTACLKDKFFVHYQPIAAIAFAVLLLMLAALFG